MMNGYVKGVTEHPIWVLSLIVLLTISALFGIAQLKFSGFGDGVSTVGQTAPAEPLELISREGNAISTPINMNENPGSRLTHSVRGLLKRGGEGDPAVLSVALGLMAVVLISLSVRSFRGIFVPLSVMLVSSVWTLGLMGRLGLFKRIDILIVEPIMLITCAYGLIWLARYYVDSQSNQAKGTTQQSIRDALPALMLVLPIVAGSTVALWSNPTELIREYVVIALVNMAVMVLLTVSFVPAYLELTKSPESLFLKSRQLLSSYKRALVLGLTSVSTWYAHFVTGRPKSVLTAIALLTVVMGYGLTQLETRNDQDSDLPSDDPIVATKKRIDGVFGDKGVVTIGIQAENIYATSTLEKISRIAEQLKNVDNVIPDEIYGLSTANNIKGKEWGLDVGRFMKSVPQTDEELQALITDVGKNELVYGKMVATSGKFTAIRANLEDDYDQATVHRQVYEIIERYQGPEKIYVTGDPIFTQEIELGIQQDTAVLIPLALLLIMVGMYLFFRTLRGVLLPFLVITLTIVWAMGLMGFTGLPQTVVSTALPMLMVVVTGSYCIHFLLYYYEAISQHEVAAATRIATERVTPALFMVGISSAMGAATLLVFRVVSIREFSIIVVMGVFAALILTMTVMPACLTLMKKPKINPMLNKSGWIEGMLTRVTAISVGRYKTVIVMYSLLVAVSVVGVLQIRTGNDVVSIFPEDHRGRRSFEVFNDELGGARYFNVMVEANQPEEIQSPEYLQAILDFQSYMESLAGVGYTESFANVIRQISKAIEQQNVAANFVPQSREQIAQYLLLYDMSGKPGDFSDLVDYDYQRAKIRVVLSTSDPDDHKRLYQLAQDYLKNHLPPGATAEFGGDIMFWIAQVDYVVIGKILNIIVAVVLILIFVSLVFRSVSCGFLSIVPVFVGTLATFGVMGYLGIRLDFPTSIITAIAVGIGVDFSIHYLNRLVKEAARNSTLSESLTNTAKISGRAVLYDSASNILGFIVVVFSGFLPVQNFGILVSITMLVMGVSTIVLLPALITAIRPGFLGFNKMESTPKQVAFVEPGQTLQESMPRLIENSVA